MILCDDGTLSLNLTVSAEGESEDCESTGRISMYAIHISVPAAAFTYVIDVHDPQDALCALMLVLAIDAEKCSRNN